MLLPIVAALVLVGSLAFLVVSYFKASGRAASAVAGVDATLRRMDVGLVLFRGPNATSHELGWRFRYGPPEARRPSVTAFARLGGRVIRMDRAAPNKPAAKKG